MTGQKLPDGMTIDPANCSDYVKTPGALRRQGQHDRGHRGR